MVVGYVCDARGYDCGFEIRIRIRKIMVVEPNGQSWRLGLRLWCGRHNSGSQHHDCGATIRIVILENTVVATAPEL
jgi:hypothetical protein